MLIKFSPANERRIKSRFSNCLEVVRFDYHWQKTDNYVIAETY